MSNSDLTIPDAAIEAAEDAFGETHFRGALTYVLRAAAPLILAAELRRQADEFAARFASRESGTNRAGFRAAADLLGRRADELDPRKEAL